MNQALRPSVKRITLSRDGDSLVLRAQIERGTEITSLRLDRMDCCEKAYEALKRTGQRRAKRHMVPFRDSVTSLTLEIVA